jgi:DNA-directed RNA polymerase sigma subunit (sigma70/sigma32)
MRILCAIGGPFRALPPPDGVAIEARADSADSLSELMRRHVRHRAAAAAARAVAGEPPHRLRGRYGPTGTALVPLRGSPMTPRAASPSFGRHGETHAPGPVRPGGESSVRRWPPGAGAVPARVRPLPQQGGGGAHPGGPGAVAPPISRESVAPRTASSGAASTGTGPWGLVRNHAGDDRSASFAASLDMPPGSPAAGEPSAVAPPASEDRRTARHFTVGPFGFDLEQRIITRDGVVCTVPRRGAQAPMGRAEFHAAIVLFKRLGQFVSAAELRERLGIGEGSLKVALSLMRAAMGLQDKETLGMSGFALMPDTSTRRGFKGGIGIFDMQAEHAYLRADPAADPADVLRVQTGREDAPDWILHDKLCAILRPNQPPIRFEPRHYQAARFLFTRGGSLVQVHELAASLGVSHLVATQLITRVRTQLTDTTGPAKERLIDPQAIFVVKHDPDLGSGVFAQAAELGLVEDLSPAYSKGIVRGPGYFLNPRGGTNTPGCIVRINGVTGIVAPLAFEALKQLLARMGTPVQVEELLRGQAENPGSLDNAMRAMRRIFFPYVGKEVRHRLQQREGSYTVHDMHAFAVPYGAADIPEPGAALPDSEIVVGDIRLDPGAGTLSRAGRATQLVEQDLRLARCLLQSVGEPLSAEHLRAAMGLDDSAPAHALLDSAMRLRQAMNLPAGNRWNPEVEPDYVLVMYSTVGGGLFDVRDELALVPSRPTVPDPLHIVRVKPHSSHGAKEYVFNRHLWAVLQEGEHPRWIPPFQFRIISLFMSRVDHTVTNRQLIRALGQPIGVIQARVRELRGVWPFSEGLFDLRSEHGHGYRACRTRKALYPTARLFQASLPAGLDAEHVLSMLVPTDAAALRRLWELPGPSSEALARQGLAPLHVMRNLGQPVRMAQALLAAGEPIALHRDVIRWSHDPRVEPFVSSKQLLESVRNWFGQGRSGQAHRFAIELDHLTVSKVAYRFVYREFLLHLAWAAAQAGLSGARALFPSQPALAMPAAGPQVLVPPPAVAAAEPVAALPEDLVAMAAAARKRMPHPPDARSSAIEHARAVDVLAGEHALDWPSGVALEAALAEQAPSAECLLRAHLGLWPYGGRHDPDRLAQQFGLGTREDARVLVEQAVADLGANARMLAGRILPPEHSTLTLERLARLLSTRGFLLNAPEWIAVLTWRGLGRTTHTRLPVRALRQGGERHPDAGMVRLYHAAVDRLTGRAEVLESHIARARALPFWPAEKIDALYRRWDAARYARSLILLGLTASMKSDLGAQRYAVLMRQLGVSQAHAELEPEVLADAAAADMAARFALAGQQREQHRQRAMANTRGFTKGGETASEHYVQAVRLHRQVDAQVDTFAGRMLAQQALRARAASLTAADVRDLMRVIEDGDAALGEFLQGNRRLTLAVARRKGFYFHDETTFELLNDAQAGTLRAAAGHDGRIAEFSTYAWPTIESTILRLSSRRLADRLKIGRHRAQEVIMTRARRNRLRDVLRQEQREPTREEIARAVYKPRLSAILAGRTGGQLPSAQDWEAGWEEFMPEFLERVAVSLELIEVWTSMDSQWSLDAPVGDKITGQDRLAAPLAPGEDILQPGVPSENLMALHLLAALDEAGLDEEEQYVLLHTFGAADYPVMEPAEMAALLGIEHAEVLALHTQALRKLSGSPAAAAVLERYRRNQ